MLWKYASYDAQHLLECYMGIQTARQHLGHPSFPHPRPLCLIKHVFTFVTLCCVCAYVCFEGSASVAESESGPSMYMCLVSQSPQAPPLGLCPSLLDRVNVLSHRQSLTPTHT